jgi:hypothetical protein
MNNGVKNLQVMRGIDGARLLDDNERFYRLGEAGERVYGYHTQLGGLYVCYTCGHLCECGEEGEQ